MSEGDRAACFADLMRMLSEDNSALGTLTKAQLRSGVDAVDQWCSDNATSFNNALPVAVRNALTAAQKARLLAFVALRRYDKGV